MVCAVQSIVCSSHSCGVYDVGFFYEAPHASVGYKFEDIHMQGCGIFRCTFIESQRHFLEEMKKVHTCIFESEPYTNMSPSAGYDSEGNRNRIILALFKHKDMK